MLPIVVLVAGGCSPRASTGSAAGAAPSGTVEAAGPSAPVAAPAAGSLADYLPDVANGFTAAPLERGPSYVRRDYRRGAVRVTITIGEMPDLSLQRWIEMSSSFDYPPAALDAPPDAAAGFYDCAGAKGAERCDLHAQTRGGLHIEVNGSGTATRADLDALMAGIPVRAMAARPSP
jgi:hypothetical protein